MPDQQRLRLVAENPIRDGLNGFCAIFALICEGVEGRSPDEAVD